MKTILFLLLASLTSNANEGRKLFEANCVICHGDRGNGDGPAASGLKPPPRNLVRDAFKNGDSLEAIANTIKTGLGQMPSFISLSDADREALAQYVHSLRSTK